jgi:VanZ family protein
MSRPINRTLPTETDGPLRQPAMPALVLIYAGLIVYGSLYPFGPWTEPGVPLFSFLGAGWPRDLSRADLIQNILVYIPLGLLVVWLNCRVRFSLAVLIAILAGGVLSLTMESIQQFIPDRTASIVDLVVNVLGTFLGGLLAGLMTQETFAGARLTEQRQVWFRTGPLPNLGLVVLALWALSQTSPLVPSLDVGHLRHGLALLYRSLQHLQNFKLAQAGTYVLYITGLGLLTFTLAQRNKFLIVPYCALVGFVLACKVLVVGRQLSLEALTGALLALLFLASLRRMPPKAAAIIGIACVAPGFTLYELAAPGAAMVSYSFNWVPFAGQMSSINGLENILEILWPFLAIGYFVRYLAPSYLAAEYAIAGGTTVLSVLFFMEWYQQFLPGRVGDITQVLIGVSGWALAFCVGHGKYGGKHRAYQPIREER